MIKLAFFCMNKRGLSVLEKFVGLFSSAEIAYVVCSRDKNVIKDYFDEIQNLCNNNDIKFTDKSSADNFLGLEDFKIAIGWRWLIKDSNNLIILHDSILPKYRGFAPLVNMLINGETELGVTAIKASEEYDTGDIIEQRKIAIEYPLKISKAIELIIPLYQELVCSIFNKIKSKKLTAFRQDNAKSSYSIWLDKSDYLINWNWPPDKIERFVNAVGYPYDGAIAMIGDIIVKIEEIEIISDCVVEDRERHIGKIIFMKDNFPVVIAKKGLILIKKAKTSNGEDFIFSFRSKLR